MKKRDEDLRIERTKMEKDRVLERLKEQGCRITRQRLILLDIILSQECSCCKEIFYEASKRNKGIGQSTVYRMVSLLEEVGAISRKNMYRISRDVECGKEEVCQVELDDDNVCRLSPKEWKEVIVAGMKKCGHIRNQKIVSVNIVPCDSVIGK